MTCLKSVINNRVLCCVVLCCVVVWCVLCVVLCCVVCSEVQKLSSLVLPSEVIIAQSSVPGNLSTCLHFLLNDVMVFVLM